MNILLKNVKMTARRKTEAMMKVEIFASYGLLIVEVAKYMNSGPKTKPTNLELIAPACNKTTLGSPALLANTITGMLILVLRTAKATWAKSDGAAKNCKMILEKFACTVLGTA
jgi:hypothetical protein